MHSGEKQKHSRHSKCHAMFSLITDVIDSRWVGHLQFVQLIPPRGQQIHQHVLEFGFATCLHIQCASFDCVGIVI